MGSETAGAAVTYRLTLGYRGSAYAGWQWQANAMAVQQVVEEALAELVGLPVRVVGASRTDAGVHARGQVAHLVLRAPFPERGLVHGANHRLPEDVRVIAAARAPDGFHARRMARSKLYRYRLVRCRVLSPLEAPFAARTDQRLDVQRMQAAAELLAGTHDFSAFALAGGAHQTTRRRIFSASWREEAEALELLIEGEGFLRGMVRSLVGTLVEVGRGRRSVASFAELLTGRSRGEAGPTAPAQGLTLEKVTYPARWSVGEPPAAR